MFLLDTHTLVWMVAAPDKLSASARRIVESGNFALSAASLWEMILKKGRSREIVADPTLWWERFVEGSGKRVLDIEAGHIRHLDNLPGPSREPFDRILISQCVVESLRLVTKDAMIHQHYQAVIRCVW